MATSQSKIRHLSIHQAGFNLAEVLIVIGLIGFMVAAIGKIISTINRVQMVSANQTKAMQYAQESMEILNDIKNDEFACRCAVDSCAGSTCTRAADGQSCGLFDKYTSCWTQYPRNLTGETEFFLAKIGADWQLQNLDTEAENIPGEAAFRRKITITSAFRDTNSNIAETGTPDHGTKLITVTVWHDVAGQTREINLKNIFTAWENL